MITDDLREHRERLVLDHFHDEVVHDWDATLATFPHPRYELVPTQRVYDGEAAVRSYYKETRVAFPDQDHEIIAIRHADDAVIVEFHLLGTHLGPLGPIPPTGGRHRTRMTAFFVFEGEELVTERIYFDQLTLLRQLLGNLDLRSPRGVLTLLRVLRGMGKLAREPKDVIPG